jgi:ribosomal protein L7Ae-like RNA K-turn-binding protein
LSRASDPTEKALSLLGLATRAGRTVVGVPLICTALSNGQKNKTPLLVLEACDSSPNTHKRITDRTAFYGVPSVQLTADCATLAHAVGKRDALVAAVGVTEPNLAKAIMEALGVSMLQ